MGKILTLLPRHDLLHLQDFHSVNGSPWKKGDAAQLQVNFVDSYQNIYIQKISFTEELFIKSQKMSPFKNMSAVSLEMMTTARIGKAYV